MTLPETRMRPVERADAASKSRPIALTKSPKKCMMRYDRSSVTLAMQSECHGASVAQVPAHTTMSRQIAVKVQPAPLKVAAHLSQPQSPSNDPFGARADEESSSIQQQAAC